MSLHEASIPKGVETDRKYGFTCHTPNLLKEVLNNQTTQILRIPMSVFGRLLYDVAARASEINDPELNALMCDLTLYEAANPESKEYDPELVKAVYLERDKLRKQKKVG